MCTPCIIEFIKEVEVMRLNVRVAKHFISFFPMSLLNSIIQEPSCKILFIIGH